MIAARKSLLFGLAALGLLSGLSGCIIAERPGHYRPDYVAEGPSGHSRHHWNNGWQGDGDGQRGDWNQNPYH